jgi:hypothetical protein
MTNSNNQAQAQHRAHRERERERERGLCGWCCDTDKRSNKEEAITRVGVS